MGIKVKNEWKNRLKNWGIFIAIWIFFMIIIFVTLAIKKSVQHIDWNLYTDFRLIGYTFGASGGFWMINFLSIEWSNRNKKDYEKSKPVSFYIWFILGLIAYLSVPILIGLAN